MWGSDSAAGLHEQMRDEGSARMGLRIGEQQNALPGDPHWDITHLGAPNAMLEEKRLSPM